MRNNKRNNRSSRNNRSGNGPTSAIPGGAFQLRNTPDNVTFRGHEIFSTLNTTAGSGGGFNGVGQLSLSLPILSDRLAFLARIYERYRLRKLTFTYIPLVGSTQVGSLAIGIDDDAVDNDTITSSSNFSTVTSMRNSVNTQLYAKASITYIPIDKLKWYYCNPAGATSAPTNRFSTQASIFVQTSSPALYSNASYGYLRLDYVVEFEGAITPSAISSIMAKLNEETKTTDKCCSSSGSVVQQKPSIKIITPP
jgi:hypothetical protein